MSKPHVRYLPFDRVEIRAGEDGEDDVLVGHAAVFDVESEPIWGMFREMIAPGAFSRAIKEKQDVRAVFNHDPSALLGRTQSGTLVISEDDRGLAVEISLGDTTTARDVRAHVERGDISQMSFAFRAKVQEWKEEGASDGMDLRTIKDVDLYDVSPVTFPAYPGTDLSMRAADDDAGGKDEDQLAYNAWKSERSTGSPEDAIEDETDATDPAVDQAPEAITPLSLRLREQQLAEAEDLHA